MFLFVLACMGLTLLIVDSGILDTPRAWLTSKSLKLGELLRCYQCTGFWSGLFMGWAFFGFAPPMLFACACAGSFLGPFGNALISQLTK